MKILVTGGTGMIGRHLMPMLKSLGHEIVLVTRTPKGEGRISWEDKFPEVDAAIHLAGARIVEKRWTKKYIEELYTSRVETAQKLKAKLTPRCKVVVTASGANGYSFGDFTSIPSDETTMLGNHICGKLCAAWENVWNDWPQKNSTRIVALRIGFVISPDDSGIQTMLPIYRAGLGGVIGSGKQRMSWIALDDLLQVFINALSDERYRGAINTVAPKPTTFKEFNDAFARAVKRPAFWPIPAFVIRLVYGKLADEMILADYPVDPKKLSELGFEWKTKTIDEAMKKAVA